jgi:hypothetical protein
MICYLDRTFCISPECINECGRKLTKEIEKAAEKWWKGFKAEGGPPIAMSCFCGGDLEEAVKLLEENQNA